jgi:Domain of unknown function (DUF4010)
LGNSASDRIAGIRELRFVKNLRASQHDITSFLGGLVNSTAAVAELSSRVREVGEGFVKLAYRGVVLATGAMLLRNSLILAILAAQAFTYSLIPMLIMLATTTILLRFSARTAAGTTIIANPSRLEVPSAGATQARFSGSQRIRNPKNGQHCLSKLTHSTS